AVKCRRCLERRQIRLYRLAAQRRPPPYPPPPGTRRVGAAREGREGAGETARVRPIGGPACADRSGRASPAGGRRRESPTPTRPDPAPVRRAPAPGQST